MIDYFKNYAQDYEEKVFWFFIHITYVKNWRQVFRSNFPKMHGLISTLDARLKAKAPEVHNTIINSQVHCWYYIWLTVLIVWRTKLLPCNIYLPPDGLRSCSNGKASFGPVLYRYHYAVPLKVLLNRGGKDCVQSSY